MQLTHLFLNPQTRLLRSGWRALIFCAIAALPGLATFFLPSTKQTGNAAPTFVPDWAMVIVYCAMIGWIALVSWLCLRFLERLRFASLGYAFHPGWWRDVLAGCVVGALLILLAVALQIIGGGTRVSVNPLWSANAGALLWGLCQASLLLVVAAAFEEILFRGYVFQTLLRDVPAWLPIILLSLFFGLAHWSNPSRTTFSTINTGLAGIWLAVAYLKTRSLWFPTALHFSWNWMMGIFFGLPVSGMPLRHSLLISTTETPVWLTGGSYGCEGSIVATIVFLLSTIWIWRANWLQIAPEMKSAWTRHDAQPATRLELSLSEKAD